jgi:hypothetical protein
MKIAARVLWVLLTCVPMMAGTRTVPIVDNSPAGTPIVNSGSVTLTENNSRGIESMSRRDDWTAKNVSQKSIVVLVETLNIRYSNGHTVQRIAEYDAFFHPQIVNPGSAIDLSYEPSDTHVADEKYSSLTQPSCEVEVRWVQFLDGTTLGDAKYAEHILESRRDIWSALSRLHKVFEQQGSDEFLKQLKEPNPSAMVDAYLEHLRNFQREHDTQGALGRLEEHLKMAETRSQLISAN